MNFFIHTFSFISLVYCLIQNVMKNILYESYLSQDPPSCYDMNWHSRLWQTEITDDRLQSGFNLNISHSIHQCKPDGLSQPLPGHETPLTLTLNAIFKTIKVQVGTEC